MENSLPVSNDLLLNARSAAELLAVKVQTLAKWRTVGGGPRFIKSGGRILYRKSDLEVWLNSRTFGSTAEFQRGGK